MSTTGRGCRSLTGVYCHEGVKCQICRDFETLETRVKALADVLYEAGVELDLEAENYRDDDGTYQPHGKNLADLATKTRAALRAAGRLP